MKLVGPSLMCLAFAVATSVAGLGAAQSKAAVPQPRDLAYPGVISLEVDATDVERGIFKVRQRVPVQAAGRLILLYPKWVNGHHAPSAPVHRLAGLVIEGGGHTLRWTRDPVDMHAIHVDVPQGVQSLEVQFQYLSETSAQLKGPVGVVATPEMLNLQWFSVAMYPAGFYARRIAVDPTVKLPSGWQLTTQLAVSFRRHDTVRFRRTDLEYLIDSPVMAGRHFRRFDLGSIQGAPVVLDALADKPEFLDAGPDVLAAHRRLVEQAGKTFGNPPFEKYNFMVALTDELGDLGTEHLASSENTRPPGYLASITGSALLAHELSHSWNGKARRPAALYTPDFNQPLGNSMLWLYEGQAQFWAYVLSTRAGLMTREQTMDLFGRLAAQYTLQPGREWRPLSDTGNGFIVTRYVLDEPWPSWHRTARDSYNEGDLIWLETDGLLRELSGGRRGMDDFAKTFFRGGRSQPSLYTFDDVVTALNQLQPYDWRTFLQMRVEGTAAPHDWLKRSGYRLIFTESPTAEWTASEERNDRVDLSYSLGLVIRGGDSGVVTDVIWGGPAFHASLVPGSTIVSVNGRNYHPELLKSAIQDNRNGDKPIELKVINRNRNRVVRIEYRLGLRYPRVERVSGQPDRLSELLAPRD